jgi:glycosyltransferase involved in cell wall biosynthesis
MILSRKIIYLMSESFPYEIFWNDPRPDVNWEIKDGLWVGHWKYGWFDQIGNEVAKLSDDFSCEVWQPDCRADKIYTYRYHEKLCHRLFPARERKQLHGMKVVKYVTSPLMIKRLLYEQSRNKLLLHLDGLRQGVVRDILRLPNITEVPKISQFLGNFHFPLEGILRARKNFLASMNDMEDHYSLSRLLQKVDIVLCCNERSRFNISRRYRKPVIVLPVGIDFDFWKPLGDKAKIRRYLELATGKFILLSSCRFNSSKQVDKMVETLNCLDENFDFQYIITGHGDKSYETRLRYLGADLEKKGKLTFTGYISHQRLLEYYNAADLFVITSMTEGSPVAAIKALAMGLPVFSTDTGYVAELLSQYRKGVVVPIARYDIWLREMTAILKGHIVAPFDVSLARSIFHWPDLASRYLDVYARLYNEYFG